MTLKVFNIYLEFCIILSIIFVLSLHFLLSSVQRERDKEFAEKLTCGAHMEMIWEEGERVTNDLKECRKTLKTKRR